MSKRTFLLMPLGIVIFMGAVSAVVLSNAQSLLVWVEANPVPSFFIGALWAALVGVNVALALSSHYFTASGKESLFAPPILVIGLIVSLPVPMLGMALLLGVPLNLVGLVALFLVLIVGCIAVLITTKLLDKRFKAEHDAHMRNRAMTALFEVFRTSAISGAKRNQIFQQVKNQPTADVYKVIQALSLLKEKAPAAVGP